MFYNRRQHAVMSLNDPAMLGGVVFVVVAKLTLGGRYSGKQKQVRRFLITNYNRSDERGVSRNRSALKSVLASADGLILDTLNEQTCQLVR